MSDLEEEVNISVVIDDNNITHIEVNINDSNDLEKKCEFMCKKYYLPEDTKYRLCNEIKNQVNSLIIKHNKNITSNCNLKRGNVQRLYYESIEKNKEKKQFIEKMQDEKIKISLRDYTFTPTINKRSNELYKRDHIKIEDKLYYDHINNIEKKKYKRLMKNIENKSNTPVIIKNKTMSNINNKKKNLSRIDSIEISEETKLSPINNEIKKTEIKAFYSKFNQSQGRQSLIKKNSYTENFKTFNLLANSNNISQQSPKPTTPVGKRNTVSYKDTPNKDNINKNNNFNADGKIIENEFNSDNEVKSLSPIVRKEDETITLGLKGKNKKYTSSESRIYMNKDKINEIVKKKNERAERELNLRCPFSPKLNKKSLNLMKERKESDNDRLNRLTNSRKIQNITKSIIKNKNEKETISKSNCFSYGNQSSDINRSQGSNVKMKKSTSNNTNDKKYNTIHTENYISTSNSERKRIREIRNEESISNDINMIRINNAEKKKINDNNLEETIKNFKSKKLSEFFELINNRCPELNIDKIRKLNLPTHVREKVIIPTCMIIHNRNLEFNFETFYHLSEKIIDTFFINQ